ncbi:MAG: helix-turn-helix transcriptional regulator [Planctomycetia bacterium]|nr:helix-turn-helix transcriptional regulator [Planctomycetia bacterium]
MADIVETLKQAIIKSKMSRYELAHKSGVSEGVLSRFVNGERGITLETAGKIAKVLKLQLTLISDRRKTT